jgi:RNA methyltransferase, TrmH family
MNGILPSSDKFLSLISILLILLILSKMPPSPFMPPEFVQSRQNPRVQNLARLRERAHRDAQQRFLVEGRRELERALARGVIEEVYICPEYFREMAAVDFQREIEHGPLPVCQLAPSAFDKVSLREGPDGFLGVAQAWRHALADLPMAAPALVLVVEAVEKPGNLGALLRTAEAAGAAVIVCDPVTDLFNPHVVRNSQGALFSLPLAVCDAAAAIEFLQARNIAMVATTPDPTAPCYWDLNLRGAAAIVVGSEKTGLSATWLTAAQERARVPMAGAADSLNVASAAAILLFEAVRQRKAEWKMENGKWEKI